MYLFFQDHGRYCQAVRYSPDGAFWASAGFDGKLVRMTYISSYFKAKMANLNPSLQFLYEGKDSELVAEVTDGKAAHAGGIYGVSWSPDGKQLLSASGDKTCKVRPVNGALCSLWLCDCHFMVSWYTALN